MITKIERKAIEFLRDQGANISEIRNIFSSGKGTRAMGIIIQTLADHDDLLGSMEKEKVLTEKRAFDKEEYENQPGNPPTQSVLQIDLKTGKVVNIFPSITKAAKATKGSATQISNILRGCGVSSGGYGWKKSSFLYKECPRCRIVGTVAKRFGYLNCQGKKRPRPYCTVCYKIVTRERNDKRKLMRSRDAEK